ncbi:hypothetical protein [Nocardiopsis sp. TNDT3]|uniref:hypothetical protein n=1 Tax=Nocardiopsis sp. TNDT3 TaxID=2249354 RepID=UPI0013004F69|nr:hypothetical protein [Nocardiopsis sp. TNDT3]
MTGTPEDEQANEAGTEDPKGQTPPRTIKVKSGDGEWREISVEPKKTGDPELDSLWEMPYSQFEEITKDPDHPLHQKALQVQTEAFKPITSALSSAINPLAERLNTRLGALVFDKPLMQRLDTKLWQPPNNFSSWASKIVSNSVSPMTGLTNRTTIDDLYEQEEGNQEELPEPVRTPTPHAIDFDSLEPPYASLSEIATASESKAQEIRVRQVEILDALLAQAQSDSEKGDEALEVAINSKKASWIAAWAGIGALIVSIAGIIVTMLQ